MDDTLTQRVDALERAVTDGDHDLSALATDAQARDRLDSLETQCEQLEARVAELEAATQALRGYVGNVRSVNEEVETQAQRALSKAESLETRLSSRDDGRPPEAGLDESTTRDGTTSHAGVEQASAEQLTDPQGRADREGPNSADGDRCCQTCGRPHSRSQTTEADTGAEWPAEAPADDDPLVAESSDEAGALERFKQLL